VAVGQAPPHSGAPPAVALPSGPGASAEAARVLALAADRATIAPAAARPDQYLLVESVDTHLRYHSPGMGGPTYAEVTPAVLTRRWQSVDDEHDNLEQTRPWPAGGAWQQTMTSGCHNGRRVVDLGHPEYTEACRPRPLDVVGGLPTDTEAMLAYLYRPGDDGGLYAGWSNDEKAFSRANAVVENSLLTPAVRASVYRAVARIPGVTLVGPATDVAGRHGIAVSRTYRGLQLEMIFDAKTYDYLGRAMRVTNLHDYFRGVITRGIRPGDPLIQTAVRRIAVVDRPGQLR
jgi:hypothetical protein